MIRRNQHEYKGGAEAASTLPSAPPQPPAATARALEARPRNRLVLLRCNLRIIFWPFVIMRDSG